MKRQRGRGNVGHVTAILALPGTLNAVRLVAVMRLTVTAEAPVSGIADPGMGIQPINGTLCSADPAPGVRITMMAEALANAATNTCFSLLRRLHSAALPTMAGQSRFLDAVFFGRAGDGQRERQTWLAPHDAPRGIGWQHEVQVS